MEGELRDTGLDSQMLAAIHDMLDFSDLESGEKAHPPTRAFLRDTKAMRGTSADVLEFPTSYVFIVDMPGARSDQVKAHMEDGNILVVSGERRRDKEKEHKERVRYVKMERRQSQFLKRFELPDNANTDSISANYQDGVLTITVEKRPPPEPKKPRTIEIKVGPSGHEQGTRGHGEGGKGRGQGEGEGDGTAADAGGH